MYLYPRESKTGPYGLFKTSNNSVNACVTQLTDSHEDYASCHVQASNWARDTLIHLACDSCSKVMIPSKLKRILYFVRTKGFEADLRTPTQGPDRCLCLFSPSFLFLCQKLMRRMVQDSNH